MNKLAICIHRIRFVGDAGMDDQKLFAYAQDLNQEFVLRVCHLERIVDVSNERLQCWETEKLQALISLAAVRAVYNNWRLRDRIEHGYRFDQEQGLDVEDMRIHTIERMHRIFAMVLLAAQFVFVVSTRWLRNAVLWLRQLGGKLNNPCDRDGPYWLLQGLSAVITTCMSLSFACLYPFPFKEFTCG